MKPVFIVAEIGCNHNGSKNLAKRLVDAAKDCNVDAVKFQTFDSHALISKFAPKAEYQKETTGTNDTQLEMTRKLELGHDNFLELREYALSLGLKVFSTPFDIGSIDFLCSIGQNFWKIPSGEITNLPYLRRIAKACGHSGTVILSTGMATIDEIASCLRILKDNNVSDKQIIILHCNTEYPTPDKDVNVSAINDLKKHFPHYRVGFSDHSVGCVAAVGAVMLDIALIEKHFTLDKNLPGPDHKASATPDEMTELVKNVRRMEILKGNGKKYVTESERKNIIVARKSIVASCTIKKGEFFSEKNITTKRPGNGISPMQWDNIIGKKAEKNFSEDELIIAEGFDWQL